MEGAQQRKPVLIGASSLGDRFGAIMAVNLNPTRAEHRTEAHAGGLDLRGAVEPAGLANQSLRKAGMPCRSSPAGT